MTSVERNKEKSRPRSFNRGRLSGSSSTAWLDRSKSKPFFLDQRRGVVIPVRFQCFRIELLSRAAIETAAVRCFSSREGAAQVFVPAAEKLRHQTDFFAEDVNVDFFRRPSAAVHQILKFIDKQFTRHKPCPPLP
jgi:hypothetical protein